MPGQEDDLLNSCIIVMRRTAYDHSGGYIAVANKPVNFETLLTRLARRVLP